MLSRLLALLVVLTALGAAGCGDGGHASGLSHSGSGGHTATSDQQTAAQVAAHDAQHARLARAWDQVKSGMSMRRVETLLGAPRHRMESARSGICWFYGRSTQPLSPGEVCFKRHRASFVMSPALAAVQVGVIERGGGTLTLAAVDKTRRELRQEGYRGIQCSEKRVAGKLTSITCGGDKPGVAGLDTTTLAPLQPPPTN